MYMNKLFQYSYMKSQLVTFNLLVILDKTYSETDKLGNKITQCNVYTYHYENFTNLNTPFKIPA